MKISGAIKRYMEGILLVMLAGFILGAIQYVVSIVPDNALSPNLQESTSLPDNPYLVRSYTIDVNGGGFGVDIDPRICGTSTGRLYLAIDISQLNGGYPASLTAWFTNWDTFQNEITKYKDTNYYQSYIYVGWRCLYHIDFALSGSPSGRVYLYLFDAPSIDEALAPWLSQTTTSGYPPPTISNKLILSFISWIAGIILLLQALNKFGIPI